MVPSHITDQTDKHWSKPRKPPTIEALTVKPDGEVALIAFHSPLKVLRTRR